MSDSKTDRTILVVEDDPDINHLLMKITCQCGYQVKQAYSGTEAHLILSMEAVDMVLLDLMLPGLPGEELIQKIRENSEI